MGRVTRTCSNLDETATGAQGAGARVMVVRVVVVRCYVMGRYHEGRRRSWSVDLYVCIGSTRSNAASPSDVTYPGGRPGFLNWYLNSQRLCLLKHLLQVGCRSRSWAVVASAPSRGLHLTWGLRGE